MLHGGTRKLASRPCYNRSPRTSRTRSEESPIPSDTPTFHGERYRLLGALGEGGTGRVYRAFDRLEGREVALKVLDPPAGEGGEAFRVLGRREFRLLASHSHPHLVRVLDYGLTRDGRSFFTMELLEGKDLLSFARDESGSGSGSGPRRDELRRVVRQVLEALDYIHTRGILHLDLKPSNILVTVGPDGAPSARLLDFGLAEGAAVAPPAPSAPGGTLEYVAPERLRGEAPDGRSDLYALGVVLWEALTGAPPLRGETAAEVIRAHLEAPLPDPAGLPASYRDVVLRLLARDPAARPATARDVLIELFGEDGGLSILPPFGAALVGREAVIARLEDAARSAARGAPRTVLITGPAGIGKSALLREIEVRGLLAGRAVCLEACGEGARPPGEVLRRLLRRAGLGAGLDGGLDGDLEGEGAAPAGLAGTPRTAGGPALEEGEARREGLLRTFTRRLLELAEARPLTLLVDDIERADSLSREGIIRIARVLEARSLEEGSLEDDARAGRGGPRLALIVTEGEGRGESRGDGGGSEGEGEGAGGSAGPALELERAAAGFASFESHRLEGLGPDDVARYLSQVLGPEAFPPELAARLAAETGGNVLFVEEYLKLLIETGHIRRSGGRWQVAADGAAYPLPATVEETLAKRLNGVRGLARRILEWTALSHRPQSAEELCALLEESRAAVEGALSDLVLARLLARAGARYVHAHGALREVVSRSLPEAERRRRHGVIAERLLAALPAAGASGGERDDGFGDRVEALAYHLYRSEEPERAGPFLLEAGKRAAGCGALREAESALSASLEVTRDPRARFDRILWRQDVAGHLGRKAAQEEDIRELHRLAKEIADPALEREAVLRESLYLDSLGRKREALERLGRAAELARGDVDRARVLVRVAMIHFFLAEFDAGFAALERALAAARAVRERQLEAECLQVSGLGEYRRGRYERALEDFGRALVLWREEGAEHRRGAIESNLGMVHFDRGDLEAAEERFGSALRTFRRLGLRRGEAVSLLNLGLAYLEMGRYQRAIESMTEAIRIRRELGDRRAEGADMGNLGEAWIRVGRLERAVPLLEAAVRRAREHDNRQSESANEHRLGLLDLERGDLEGGAAHLERALSLCRDRLPAQEALVRGGLARARLGRGGVAAAKEEAAAALRLAEAGAMRARGITCAALLAAVHLEAGELAEADRLSRRAVEEIEARSGWLADAHWVWFQRYRVLEARRRAGDSGSTGLPAEAEADGALRRAYSLLREKSDAFADQELRRTFLENIGLHREINRLHEELQARTRREGARRERSFHEIARSIHSLVELDPLLDRLLELAIETTHAEKGLIVLKDAAGDFITRAARGMLRESVDDAAEICQSVIEDVKRGGKPVLAADAGSDQRFRDRRSIISFHIRTLMCVPLEERGETIGAVYVDGRGASSFDHDDLEYLVAFGQLAAIAVENVKRLERLRAENSDLRRQVEARFRFENLLAESPAMDRVLRTMEKVARTSASVLVSGETGTGKEVVARAIHCASERRARPFVTVDCGALPESLLESELFGHRRGAFSGAIHDRVGLFEEAEGGTLFLDEITNTSLDLQAKLLRALQEREIRRVGENRVQRVDVRVIAATNVDIRKAVADGRFREDLFWRLNVVPIEIPPLRERREDIPLLAAHFLAESARRHGREISGFTEDGLRYLSEAAWRGNVRELENLIEKAVILAEGGRLDGRFLASLAGAAGAAGAEAGAAGERAPAPSPAAVAAGRMSPLPILPEAGLLEAPLSLEEFDRAWLGAERRYLERLVEEVGGNLAAAARRARVRNRNTLISRLRKHGIGRAGGRHGLRAGPPVSEGSAHETSTPGAEA